MINSSDFILENDIYKNCILKKYVGTDAEVVVPETVQKIGSGAFAERTDLSRVILPDGLFGIEEDAFAGCSPSLKLEFTWLQFNKLSKASKESMALLWLRGEVCFSEKQVDGIKKGILKRKTDYFRFIKWGGTDFNAWNRCNNIQESQAFANRATNEKLPWDDEAVLMRFLSCGDFTEEDIDAFIESANDGDHVNMTAVLLDYKNSQFGDKSKTVESSTFDSIDTDSYETIVNNWKFIKDKKAGGYKITGYIGTDLHPLMPEKIKDIDVISISNEAFAYSGITGMELPGTISSIGASAFKNCRKLTELRLPDKIKDLPKALFSSCDDLKRVKLPAELETIASSTFIKGCSNGGENGSINMNLEELFIAPDNPVFGTADGVLYEKKTGKLLHYPAKKRSFAIPQSITTIPQGVFSCSDLSDIKFHNNVSSIGSYAFYKCKNLKEIVIPDGKLKTIGKNAFQDCTELSNAILPNGLRKIEDYAFSGCSKLIDITIPATVQTIGAHCFDKNTVIHSSPGSYAEQYANENGITFIEM